MSEAGPSIDRSSLPSTDRPALATPKPLSTGRYDQNSGPSDVQRAVVSSPTDDRMRVEFPPRSHTVPERSTAHQDPPITPLSPALPLSGNQGSVVPLLPPTMPENRPEVSQFQHRSTRRRLLAFFGFGGGPELRERKDLMSLIWNLGFNGAQVRPVPSYATRVADS